MKIGMVLDNEFTGDMRVENEVVSLVQAGHEVFVLCFNYGNKKSRENYEGGTILRIDIDAKVKGKMKGLTNFIIDPYTYYWSKKIISFVREYNIEVLHMHDLFMLGAAFRARRKLKATLPIVGDLHENYPEALKYYKFSNTFPGNLLISIPKWERTEKKWIQQADHIITVIEEAVDRYGALGLDVEKMTVVANYVRKDEFLKGTISSEMEAVYKNEFTLSYIGGFDTHRGIDEVIKALPLVRNEIPNVKLILVGAGRNEADLKALAHSLNIDDLIDFKGWQPPTALPSFISASDICLIPHLKTNHTDNTIPHKLFQYMLMSKPVIASNCTPIERILKSAKAGLSYTSGNEKELAECILSLHKDRFLLKEMGQNGQQAVHQTYNWENTAKNLVALYDSIQL